MSKAMEQGKRIVEHINAICGENTAISRGDDPMTLEEFKMMADSNLCYAHIYENFLMGYNMGSVFLFDIRQMPSKSIENILAADSIAIVDDELMGMPCVCQLASCNY